MKTAAREDWKWQALDLLDRFVSTHLRVAPEAADLLTCCEGQENLALDGIKGICPTLQFQRGDKLTALEFGHLFGHWQMLCYVIVSSETFAKVQDKQFASLIDMRSKVDEILKQHLPDTQSGPTTGIVHLLAELGDPRHREALKAAEPEFRQVCGEVIAMAHRKGGAECRAFIQGYSEAVGTGSVSQDGKPVQRDQFKELLMLLWPFAKHANLSTPDLHQFMDSALGQNLTGNRERLTKHLNRQGAGLRGKGRPKKR